MANNTDNQDQSIHDQVKDKLLSNGQRYTSGRKRLVELLIKANGPVTLPDIVSQDEELAQSSAYRNLDVLEQCKAVVRISGTGEHAHYELAESLLGHHHHLICSDCGQITDFELDHDFEELITAKLIEVADASGFSKTGHNLDLVGICSSCR